MLDHFLLVSIAMNNRSTITLNATALKNNIAHYKKACKGRLLGVVIKSNAYGHGLIEIGKLLQLNNNVDWFFVASLSEAILLRKQGITKPILAMYHLDGDPKLLSLFDISIMVTDMQTVQQLSEIGKQSLRPIKIHVKIDTGLSRFGFPVTEALSVALTIKQHAGIVLEGIYSHLAEAAQQDSQFTVQQIELFNHVLQQLAYAGITIPFRHIANTAATTAYELGDTNLVRVGLGIYGLWPSVGNEEITKKKFPEFELEPVLAWHSKIEFIRELKVGDYVGYDRTFKAEKNSKIAIVPVGYFDGYDRRFSNNALVMINNFFVPVVGRIAMTTMMVDITTIDAKIGDQVTLIGSQELINPSYLVITMQSYNPRELLTRISEGIPRVISSS